jgi:hypothetical protein
MLILGGIWWDAYVTLLLYPAVLRIEKKGLLGLVQLNIIWGTESFVELAKGSSRIPDEWLLDMEYYFYLGR